VKRELEEMQPVVGPTEGTDAAQDLLDEVLESDSSTFDKLQMPGIYEGTIEFSQPITCRSGDSVNVDLQGGTVQVLNSDGEEVCSTTIVSEQPKPVFDLKAPTVQSEILLNEPEVYNLGSVNLNNFLDPGIEEAAEELSRVGGVSLAGARDAVHQALNAFTLFADTDPLEDMMAGNIVTTVEEPQPGELLGKVDRPLEEIREQAKHDILRHTRDHTASNSALDELIGHPSHLQFIKQKQDEAFRKGYEEALAKMKSNLEMETGDCGPDCDCGRYELGS
jgi:hypothetical protein